MSGPRGACLVLGGVSGLGRGMSGLGGVSGPRGMSGLGEHVWSRVACLVPGACLVWGAYLVRGVCLIQGGMSVPGGAAWSGTPPCEQNDTQV